MQVHISMYLFRSFLFLAQFINFCVFAFAIPNDEEGDHILLNSATYAILSITLIHFVLTLISICILPCVPHARRRWVSIMYLKAVDATVFIFYIIFVILLLIDKYAGTITLIFVNVHLVLGMIIIYSTLNLVY